MPSLEEFLANPSVEEPKSNLFLEDNNSIPERIRHALRILSECEREFLDTHDGDCFCNYSEGKDCLCYWRDRVGYTGNKARTLKDLADRLEQHLSGG